MTERAPLPPPDSAIPRRTEQDLPPYRYVPGLLPHPFRHEGGHMYTDGSAPTEAPWIPQARPSEDIRFCYAADLFDQRFYWEAHEAWEAMWHSAEDGTAVRDLLQSLIQYAASALQHHMGHQRGSASLLTRADDRLKPWRADLGDLIYGVDTGRVLTEMKTLLAGGDWPLIGNIRP